jgi:hypothetical protein
LQLDGPLRRLGQRAEDGDGEEVVDVAGDEPAGDDGHQDEGEGAQQAAAQFVQVFEERHLRAEPPLVALALVLFVVQKS